MISITALIICLFISTLLKKINKPIVVCNKSFNHCEFEKSFFYDSKVIFELLLNDLNGNVSIFGKSIKFYYDCIIVNNTVTVDNIYSLIKFEKF